VRDAAYCTTHTVETTTGEIKTNFDLKWIEAPMSLWWIRHAANSYNVPKSTLYDRLSGRVQFGTKSKPPRYLTDPEEEELVNFLSGWVALGYACSKRCNCLSSASSGYKGDVEAYKIGQSHRIQKTEQATGWTNTDQKE